MVRQLIKNWVTRIEVTYDDQDKINLYRRFNSHLSKIVPHLEIKKDTPCAYFNEGKRIGRAYAKRELRAKFTYHLKNGYGSVTITGTSDNKQREPAYITQAILCRIQSVRSNRRYVEDVYMKNRYAMRVKNKKKAILRTNKFPEGRKKHVGIEIEFLSPFNRSEIEDILVDHNLQSITELVNDGSVVDTSGERECTGDCRWNDCDCCNCCRCGEEHCENNNGEQCDDGDNCECSCGCDCTCEGPLKGHELRVLTTEKDYRQTIKNVCQALKECKAEVNKTCGLHVHLDHRYNYPEYNEAGQTYQRLYVALPALMRVVPASRRNNQYCKVNAPAPIPGDRYYAINYSSFLKYKTIEVRLHSGTTDARKINNWVELLIRIKDDDNLSVLFKEQKQLTTVILLNRAMKLPKRLFQYLIKRQALFNNVNQAEAA